jgi:hypothetical protein
MCAYSDSIYLRFFGGNSVEETPVPIPNTEVKLYSADGTARETVWESRTPPRIHLKPGFILNPGFFLANQTGFQGKA